MNNKEIAQLLKDALAGQDSDSIWFAIGELEKDVELDAVKTASHLEGAQDAISWLEEVYGDGIHETDAWAEYMGACDCHAEEELVCDECGETFKESEGEDATAFGLKFLCDDDYDKWHKDSLELLRSHTKEGE